MVPAIFDVHGAYLYSAVVALVSGVNFANVTYPQFFIHFVPISLVLIFMGYRWRSGGSYRPVNGKILSWEKMLFCYARWPWVFAGTITALRDWVAGSSVEFRVTPKGTDSAGPLPVRVLMPYALLSGISASAVLLLGPCRHCKWVLYLRHLQCRSLRHFALGHCPKTHFRERDHR